MVTSDAHEALFGYNHLGIHHHDANCNDMLTMLVCTTCWLSLHPYTLAYMSMHKSYVLVCHPCFNIMKLWTFDPNLHLSLSNTTFCLPSCFVCLFVYLFACFLVCLCILLILSPATCYACHVYHIYLFMPLSYAFCIFSFHCLSLPLHVRTWNGDTWS